MYNCKENNRNVTNKNKTKLTDEIVLKTKITNFINVKCTVKLLLHVISYVK